MPRESVDPIVSSPAATTELCPTLSGRILLAEDSPENQRLLSYLLRRAGATVEVVDNGARALEAIVAADNANIPFDLLVTDREMPRMDGAALAAAVRARGLTMPIIALTAQPSPDNPMHLFACGCDDYATKPIEEHDLLAMCAHWLARRTSSHPRFAVTHHAA